MEYQTGIESFNTQWRNGAILGDLQQPIDEKKIYDPETNVQFSASFLEHRQLRGDKKALIAQGLMQECAEEKLINSGCPLCPHNIALEIPGEVMLLDNINSELWCIAPNFAWLSHGHLTVMPIVHRSQQYSMDMLTAMGTIVQQTDGRYTLTYNGPFAGASILGHAHLQGTPSVMPIETIRIRKEDSIFSKKGIAIWKPLYYVPVLLIEGERRKVEWYADKVVSKWLELNGQNDLNIITTMRGTTFRVFIAFRDKERLIADGKTGALASFEIGGAIIFSSENERELFKSIDLTWIKRLLTHIAPPETRCNALFHWLGNALSLFDLHPDSA